MYNLQLTTSHFPKQNDVNIRNITVGGVLREVAAMHPDATAMVDVADSGNCGQSWTYGELLEKAESLASALVTRFKSGEKVVVWAPNIPEWIFMEAFGVI